MRPENADGIKRATHVSKRFVGIAVNSSGRGFASGPSGRTSPSCFECGQDAASISRKVSSANRKRHRGRRMLLRTAEVLRFVKRLEKEAKQVTGLTSGSSHGGEVVVNKNAVNSPDWNVRQRRGEIGERPRYFAL